MKNSANSNMYEVSLVEAWERFGARLDGAFSCVVLVLSSSPLSEQARLAISNSVKVLGYGEEACTFLVIDPVGDAEDTAGALSGAELFSAIEGLDPLAMIIADEHAAKTCADAYRSEVPVPDTCRLLGRDVIGFKSFESLLDTPEKKQQAWGLLKRLPGPTRT